MLAEERDAFDRNRDLTDKAVTSFCYAPFTSMYLDPRGDVIACCQNTEHLLGNVAQDTLTGIWHGPRAEELRAALAAYDLAKGCRFCRWQLDDGNLAGTYSHSFESLPVTEPRPSWPARLEFAVSNTCNLECVMCNGEWSSAIRARREHRPPLPKVYGDRFFDELRPFLHHLTEARFLGGEPFLASETLRIMDLMVEEGVEVPCHLTTNGTQWTPRVERILERLPVSLAVSLDGVTQETVESIRVGASHAQLMANLARYRAYTEARGTTLDLTFCLMQQNWHEFGDYLQLADDWGCRVFINTVIHPRFGLYHLPLDQFDEVVARLEQEDARRRATLTRNREVWSNELDRLRSWSRRAHEEQDGAPVAAPYRPVTPRQVYFQDQIPATLPTALRAGGTGEAGDPRGGPRPGGWDEPTAVERATRGMTDHQVSVLHTDAEDVVTLVRGGDDGEGPTFLGVPAAECLGRPFPEVAAALARRHGDHVRPVRDDVVDGAAFRQVVYRDLDGHATYLQVWSYPRSGPDGYAGSVSAAAWSTSPPTWATESG